MLGQILLLVLGFVFMIKGADIFVDGASKIAVKCNIPEMVVGLTIVAMGTSAPEAAVSIKAALSPEDHRWKCTWKQYNKYTGNPWSHSTYRSTPYKEKYAQNRYTICNCCIYHDTWHGLF